MSENSQPVQKASKLEETLPDVENPAEDDPGLKPHPLMMSVVLRCIFDKIGDIADLKSCRLVNTTWNEAAIYSLNKLCDPVSFSNSDELENLKSCIAASNSDTNRWRFPFTKFNILPRSSKISVEGFLPVIAPWVTEIVLLFNMENCPKISKTSPLFNLELPSLKSLNISLQIFSISDKYKATYLRHRGMCLNFVSKLIQNSANLEELRLSNADDRFKNHRIQKFDPMLNQILDSMETKTNRKLRVLEINSCVGNSHLKRLMDLHLYLTYFQLDFGYSTGSIINAEILRDFLQTQSETLVELKLRHLKSFSSKEVLFPSKMEKLKSIEIRINGLLTELETVKFPHLNLNDQMPVLTEIYFSDHRNASWMGFYSYHLTNAPVTSVKRVRFSGFHPNLSIDSLMRIFPNATYVNSLIN